MAHGAPDFWRTTLQAMPVIGSGQVVWFQSESVLVDAEGSADALNYVVPDDMDLHVCSGLVSCEFPRLQRYDLRTTPAGSWVSPTSHIDPDYAWGTPENAYDGNLETRAYVVPHNPVSYLQLLLSSPTNCDKVRIYAHSDVRATGEDVNPEIEIDVYYEGGWHNILSGEIAMYTWVEAAIGAVKFVSQARIKGTNAYNLLRIYEFEFDTAEVTPQEGVYFDTHAIIPFTSQAPYIVPAGATFAVRTYNDDDAAHWFAVNLAGFLQSKV